MSFIEKIFGDPNAKELSRLEPTVKKINALEPDFAALTDEQLKAKTTEYKNRLTTGETLDDLLPEAFALVREASRRVLGLRHYDVQLIGGMILHRGEIAEMRTGEGKTLVATLPVYLNALAGRGVHVITVNDYLARRDMVWMGKIYHALGLSISCIQQQGLSYLYDPEVVRQDDEDASEEQSQIVVDMDNLREISRKEAYAADITYGTNNEFGFDYLRDNMAQTTEGQTQRELYYSIVDEVDSILIDEARTPLIISAPAQESTELYGTFTKIIPRLSEGADYNVDEKMKAATLTEEGIHKVEKELGVENLYAEGGIRLVHHLEQALKAHTLFKRDTDYVIRDGEVVIVDEFTGRLMFGRRYSDGLHQAIEAKENVPVQQESVTRATITFQNYFRMYEKLSGMTGTAKTEEEEFAKIYGLPVVVIPTNRPIARIDFPDRIYKNEKGKFQSIVKEIKEKSEIGQPILVGTVSIEKNERLSQYLTKAGVKHEVLNAKDHEREAQVIAQAGRPGAVTVATNMAGRGIDIKLGGDPADPDMAETVKHLGGLHVIGTERHESRRIDNQLRGRSGRQGDPGSTVFFISTEDDLMRIFGSDRMKSVMERLGVPDDMPIENKIISKSIESAQKKVEGHNFDIRKHLVEYDDVVNKHREVIYKQRQQILKPSEDQESLKDQILDMVEQEIREVVAFHTQNENQEEWNMDEIYETIDTVFPIPLEVRFTMQEVEEKAEKNVPKRAKKEEQQISGREALIEYLIKLSEEKYNQWEQSITNRAEAINSSITQNAVPEGENTARENETAQKETAEDEAAAKEKTSPAAEPVSEERAEFVRTIERAVMLRSIDTLWVEHIDAMSHLRTGIGLRGYGQRDPLVEYKKEAYKMFETLRANIRRQIVYSIYKVGQPITAEQSANLQFAGAEKTMEQGHGQFSGISATAPSMGGAVSGDAAAGPRPAERLARKKEGVQDAPVSAEAKVGRNDPCPCGSGKKYKKCGMVNAPEHNA